MNPVFVTQRLYHTHLSPHLRLFVLCAACLLLFASATVAQDLDPRAYGRVPKDMTFLVAGFAYSHGGALTDPTLPLEDVQAAIQTPTLGFGRTFDFLGMTSQAFAFLPYSWAQVSANVNGTYEKVNRSGLSDMRLRWSVLFHGAPAATVATLAKAPRKTILGASINIIAPTGEYMPEKLINLGTNRWSFRPELALSQPFGKHGLFDVYAGVWLFTTNHSFFTGESVRKQDPLGTLQVHVSYNLKPSLWIALDGTYYTGGQSNIDGVKKDDRQYNSRIGATMVVPTGKQQSLKIAVSTGAIVRAGPKFTTYTIGWQQSWLGKSSLK